MERSHSWGAHCSQYESEIKKLRKQLEIEHGISASFKLKLQDRQNLTESFKKKLEEIKMEKERASSDVMELQKELDMKVSEIEQLKEKLNKKSTNGLEKFLESMKASIEIFQKENMEHMDKGVMVAQEPPHVDIAGVNEEVAKELLYLLKHILDMELEKSSEKEEYKRIINDLQVNYECQRAQLLKLCEVFKEEVAKQDHLMASTSKELQQTNEIVIGVGEKLADCIGTIKAKGDELLNLQFVLSQLHTEREIKGRLEQDAISAREEMTKTSQLLTTAKLELEASKKEKQEIAHKLSHCEGMLVESTNKIKELEEANSELHCALERSMKKINNISTDSVNYIDRRIVAKLLITYFQRNNSEEVLDLMVRLLGLSEEDKTKLGSARRASERTGVHSILNITSRFVGGVLGSQSSELSPKELRQSQSIADLWVDFLLKEAEQREKSETTEAEIMQNNSNITAPSPRQDRTS